MKVKGKRVVITGAASGIGKALAVAFHSAGAAAVIASDINKAGIQSIAAEIKSEGIVTDVTNEEDIIRLIKESNDNYGGIDIFCSNVGIGAYEDFLKLTNAEWRKMFDTNLMSHIYVVRHVLPDARTRLRLPSLYCICGWALIPTWIRNLFGYKTCCCKSCGMVKNHLWKNGHWCLLFVPPSCPYSYDCRGCWCSRY